MVSDAFVLGGLIRSVGTWPDGDKGVTLGHALRRTDNDTLILYFLLSVCNHPVIGLNQYPRIKKIH